MVDQAKGLRELARQSLFPSLAGRLTAAHRLFAVAGGKGGVGATSVAVNLAIALARLGRRVVLVDANLERGDAASLCRLTRCGSLDEVLSGRRTLGEAILPGPAGIRVLCGAFARGGLRASSADASQRLLDGLAGLATSIDEVIVEVGCTLDQAACRFWQAADQVLLVTTPEPLAVMDSYAAIKALRPAGCSAIRLVVNQAPQAAAAHQAHHRLSFACQRFLGAPLACAGWLPVDPCVEAAAHACRPFILEHPDCPGARAVAQLAQSLMDPRINDRNATIDSTGAASRTDNTICCR